jgi:hypothetical protein
MRSRNGQPITPQSFGRDREFRIFAKLRFGLLRRIRFWSRGDSSQITRYPEPSHR